MADRIEALGPALTFAVEAEEAMRVMADAAIQPAATRRDFVAERLGSGNLSMFLLAFSPRLTRHLAIDMTEAAEERLHPSWTTGQVPVAPEQVTQGRLLHQSRTSETWAFQFQDRTGGFSGAFVAVFERASGRWALRQLVVPRRGVEGTEGGVQVFPEIDFARLERLDQAEEMEEERTYRRSGN